MERNGSDIVEIELLLKIGILNSFIPKNSHFIIIKYDGSADQRALFLSFICVLSLNILIVYKVFTKTLAIKVEICFSKNCKFGSLCKNPKCLFTHTTLPAKSQLKWVAPMVTTIEKGGEEQQVNHSNTAQSQLELDVAAKKSDNEENFQ